MKRIPVLLLSLLLLSLALNAKKGDEIKIIEATVQHWTAGMPVMGHPGSGEHYIIKVYVNTHKQIDFKKLWIRERNVPFRIQVVNSTAPKDISMGDSIVLDYNTADGNEQPALQVPGEHKGAATIKCVIAGKAYYFVIKEFKRLPDFSGR